MNRMQDAKAVVFTEPGKIEVQSFKIAECGPEEIVVRTLYTMVSAGTELRVLAGHYGAAGKFPLIPGYSVVGEVVSVGERVKGFQPGDLVSGRNPIAIPGITSYWGGQASLHVYRTKGEDRPVLLPAGANPIDYVIAEISAISLRGVEAAAPKSGESAVVIGQGLIGAFSAAWLHARGCRVIVTDIEQSRLDRALGWGAFAAVKSTPKKPTTSESGGNPLTAGGPVDEEIEARLSFLLNGGADIVVESSGTPYGALLSYRLARRKPQNYGNEYKVEPIAFYHQDWPRIIMQANYLEPVALNPFGFVPGEGVTILAPKDRGVEDRQKAVEGIRRGLIKSSHFVDKVVSHNDAPAAYLSLRDDKNSNFSLVIDWTKA